MLDCASSLACDASPQSGDRPAHPSRTPKFPPSMDSEGKKWVVSLSPKLVEGQYLSIRGQHFRVGKDDPSGSGTFIVNMNTGKKQLLKATWLKTNAPKGAFSVLRLESYEASRLQTPVANKTFVMSTAPIDGKARAATGRASQMSKAKSTVDYLNVADRFLAPAIQLENNRLRFKKKIESIDLSRATREFDGSGEITTMGDEGVEAIVHALQNRDTEWLEQFNEVTTLVLACNMIGEDTYSKTWGVLSYTTAIGKLCFEIPNRFPSLLVLNLAYNCIDDSGVAELAEGLKPHLNLKRLFLNSNKIHDGGIIALASALPDMQALTCLVLTHNNIGEDGFTALMDKLETTLVDSVDVNKNRIPFTALTYDKVNRTNRNSEEIKCYCTGGQRGEEVVALQENEEKSLALLVPPVKHELQRMQSRATRDLVLEPASRSGNSSRRSSYAGSTQAGHPEKVFEQVDRARIAHSNFVLLDLMPLDGDEPVGNAGIKRLVELMPRDDLVDLFKPLEIINITASRVDDTQFLPLMNTLSRYCEGLRIVKAAYNRIGDVGVKALAKGTKKFGRIEKLFLNSNSIGDSGVQSLCDELPNLTSLTTIMLTTNAIGDPGFEKLLEALPRSSVTQIDLNKNDVSFEMLASTKEMRESLTNKHDEKIQLSCAYQNSIEKW